VGHESISQRNTCGRLLPFCRSITYYSDSLLQTDSAQFCGTWSTPVRDMRNSDAFVDLIVIDEGPRLQGCTRSYELSIVN
jgi:hypothetical protein